MARDTRIGWLRGCVTLATLGNVFSYLLGDQVLGGILAISRGASCFPINRISLPVRLMETDVFAVAVVRLVTRY